MTAFLEKHRPVVLVVCALVLTATIAASWGATTADIRLRVTLFGLLALILLSLLFGDAFFRRWQKAAFAAQAIRGLITLIAIIAALAFVLSFFLPTL